MQAVAGGLFWYLERTIPGTLKWLYPSAPERADEWLAEEIYRAGKGWGCRHCCLMQRS